MSCSLPELFVERHGSFGFGAQISKNVEKELLEFIILVYSEVLRKNATVLLIQCYFIV